MNKYTSFHEEPRVSFGSFTFAWEQRKLGEVVDVQCGKDYKHLSDGDIPVYGTGGYMLSVNKALSYNQDAIGIGRKGTIDKPYVLKAPFWTVDTLFYAIPKDNNKLDFLNCIFQNVDWKKKDESTGVPSLSKSTINDVDIFIPNENEQQSIGEYFCKLDHLITLHQRESELLCSVKHTKINKNKAYFTNVWEQREFQKLFVERREKTETEFEDTLLSCAINGMFLNSELFGHFRGSTTIGYLKVKKNDLILSAQNLHLGNANVNLRFEHGIISPAYKVYDIIDCDPKFIQSWVKKEDTKNFFLAATTEGASQCRKNIEWNTLNKQNISVPKIDEQKKIGIILEVIDNLITLHQREPPHKIQGGQIYVKQNYKTRFIL